MLVLPDSFTAQFDPEPDVAYAVTWSALLIAVPIGAVVGFLPAVLALVVWEWQLSRGVRRARVAGSATAAATVVATAGIYAALTAVPGTDSWTLQGLAAIAIAALISFAIAYLLVPVITTRGRDRGERR